MKPRDASLFFLSFFFPSILLFLFTFFLFPPPFLLSLFPSAMRGDLREPPLLLSHFRVCV